MPWCGEKNFKTKLTWELYATTTKVESLPFFNQRNSKINSMEIYTQGSLDIGKGV